MTAEKPAPYPVIFLRPHHISCLPFLTFDDDGADRAFLNLLTEVKSQLTSPGEVGVMAVEGPDLICQACPSCVDGWCESSLIQEDKVRRLDALLLRELGGSYGDVLCAGEWRTLVGRNWPYRVCRMCRWRFHCGAQVR